MKKWIAMLLAVMMCFALTACGGTSDPGEVKDSEKAEAESKNTPKAEPEVVKITNDNWAEYFDVRIVANLQQKRGGDPGEIGLVDFTHRLVVKPEYVAAITKAQLTVRYYCTDAYAALCTYDSETDEIIIGEPYSKEQMKALHHASVEDRAEEGEKVFGFTNVEGGLEIVSPSWFDNTFRIDGTKYSIDAVLFNRIELTVIGEITITK